MIKLISSPEVGADLANGVPSTDVQVSGTTQTKAAAEQEAKSLQVVLQSGALPVKCFNCWSQCSISRTWKSV